MSQGTAIQWATDTWNFLAGCEKVSRGCKFCYAGRLTATRLAHTDKYKGLATFQDGIPRWSREVRVHEDHLGLPLTWKRGKEAPRRVFVNSMSDLFHDDVPEDVIAEAFEIMRKTPDHRYLILSKRPKRMMMVMIAMAKKYGAPLPNVAVGVSVEDREVFQDRVYFLKLTPAAFRFLSVEPLVEDLGNIGYALGGLTPVNWVIVGGETGPKSKVAPFEINWALDIRGQCRDNGAAFFYKQPGSIPTLGGYEVDPAQYNRKAIDSGLCDLDLPAEFPDFFAY